MQRFRTTHELMLVDRTGDVRSVPVMFMPETRGKGGPAYTREEWNSGSPADWAFDPRDKIGWKTEPPTFQGGHYPGRTLSVRTARGSTKRSKVK